MKFDHFTLRSSGNVNNFLNLNEGEKVIHYCEKTLIEITTSCNVYISTFGPVYPISLVRRIGTCIYAPS
ncbi:hypothetical protein BpHYR1_007816 [Brachionus plicatilis]|uniref:Uncharacterized protein n=1 Tax=Brachionus plicatilis TaxID=10195 RepID=A0A3M7QHC1_BRAPC|nr:hypothetical protein BpHYR1_007816 [Brachionus plicatilis]